MPVLRKAVKALIIGLFLLLGGKMVVYAAMAPSFSQLSGNVDVGKEIEIDVNFSGDPKYYASKTYYLRGVFYQTSGKYCSLTQNNSGDWISSGSDPLSLYKFDTSPEGSWSGKLKVKVDENSNNYKGPGEYQFKVGRYTSSGSVSWSDSQGVKVNGPEPTPKSTSSSDKSDSKEVSYESTEDDLEEDSFVEEEPEIEAVGVVAGIDTTKYESSTFGADLEINEIVPATFSNEVIPVATGEAEMEDSKNSIPWLIAGGGTILLGSVVPIMLKRYNMPLWERIIKRFQKQ